MAVDWRRVRTLLITALEEHRPRPLRQVVLGHVTERYVRIREPDLSAAIVERYAAWHKQLVAQREDQRYRLVGSVVTDLLSEGRCASRRELEARLPSAVSIREPSLYAAWRSAREEHTQQHRCYVLEMSAGIERADRKGPRPAN